ncbi:MAG: DUF11 domain-containing protein, partial [Clostridium sp.]|uniref:DUF11 domain-containing protein n=1 Tax=Clostridium sp. TaxID=1506 RepID=UPI003F4055A3
GTDGTIPNISSINYSIVLPSAIIKNNTQTSNIVNFIYEYVKTSIVKSVDKLYATRGDILTYTFSIGNTGNAPAINVILQDTVPFGTSFVSGSIFLNDVQVPSTPSYINIGNINPNEIKTLTFKILVN